MASPPGRTTVIALLFEGALGAAALVVGWFCGYWPAIGIESDIPIQRQLLAIGSGLVAALPLLVALITIDQFPLGPFRELRTVAERIIRQMFGGASLLQLGVVSVAAGIGE